MTRRIGFVGLGAMGLPMVQNLARDPGVQIHALDPSDKPFAVLERHPAWGSGLLRAATPAALASCRTVITMLPDSRITNEVILGDGGLADHLAEGSTIIDMGSSDPVETMRLVPLLAKRGISLVDAPVSGSVPKARSGELSIMVGADAVTVEALRPVLSGMGRQIIVAGSPGAAHAMKALNNYVYAAGLLAVSEAVAIAARMGIDTSVFADVLNASSGRNVASETKLRPFILSGDYSGGFALQLQAKDLATAARLQGLAGFDAPQLALCADLWAQAAGTLPSGADNTAIHKYLMEYCSATAAE
ncbi:NAD(P)-dependent oxidoreductase [Paracoccus denitrificans]|uniref:NAD(P)-dependent oxidoreductase n=1 Tax=Paracoccus denitrificans TaxID=266 RepID=UPI000CECD3EF|nr:NAD(P)-dependent oxidoreductase [Paracoccus denitrificans]